MYLQQVRDEKHRVDLIKSRIQYRKENDRLRQAAHAASREVRGASRTSKNWNRKLKNIRRNWLISGSWYSTNRMVNTRRTHRTQWVGRKAHCINVVKYWCGSIRRQHHLHPPRRNQFIPAPGAVPRNNSGCPTSAGHKTDRPRPKSFPYLTTLKVPAAFWLPKSGAHFHQCGFRGCGRFPPPP